ncbi:OCIA domain-containing protein 1 [Culicoides brevitarsis]|uniref:OCIA domain-containing protein 1 n=1 Tax=Culicoides brevitarsis TaxID=469753 RepID=UPI00307CC743
MDPNQPQPPVINPLANYQFSSDELRVLKECERISFWQRSIPFATIAGALTYMGVKQGVLSPSKNPRLGPIPKVAFAAFFGYIAGKISYQNECAEKLMTLPNSKLAEILRQRKKGPFYGQISPDQGFGTGLALQPFSSYGGDSYSDEEAKSFKSSSLNLDDSRPTFSGLDDVYRPNLDTPPVANYDDLAPIETKPGVTYDDLRKKNREEFYKKQGQMPPPVNEQPIYRPPPVVRAPQQPSPYEPQQQVPQQEHESQRKNRYGDVWA